MEFDRKKLNRILSMNDTQLSALVNAIAAEAGVDPAALGLNPQNIQSIRQALSSAREAELQQLGEIYESYRQNRGRT